MTKRIALFNHKGGVSKTTTTFHLGWMLAQQGKKVILVDADPQCNLTSMVLEYNSTIELDRFYEQEPERNIRAGLRPAFESIPVLIKAIDCVESKGQQGLYLLPGHIRISEYEVTLGFAQELSSSLQALRNIPGALAKLLTETAEKHQADYILIDMNPSLSSLNQNLLMISDYFILPTSPDYFSTMAIESLVRVLPRWHKWAEQASKSLLLREAVYPFPAPKVRFLGTIIQNYRLREGKATIGFQNWIDKIHANVAEKLVPELSKHQMVFDEEYYHDNGIENFCLASIPDFNTLIATSQENKVPVFALKPEHLNQVGVVLKNTIEKRDAFGSIFNDLVKKIIQLAGDHENSN